MYKFMFCTFLFLAWGFWELSGGSDFEPPAIVDDTERQLATYGEDGATTATRSRLAATTPAAGAAATPIIMADQTADVVEASLTVEENVTAETDEAATIAALASGITALTNDTAAQTETYAPTTTSSAISVEPVTTGASPSPSGADVRQVAGSRVNMRNGPSTDFQVLAQLGRGDEVEVIDSPGDGWVQLRVRATGQIGWMAERLLTPITN
ncbi:MAG: SH3 domain-containing protein [Pseudomonadota bacterium]